MLDAALASSKPSPWLTAAQAAVVDLVPQALSMACDLTDAQPPLTELMGALIPLMSDLDPIQIGLFSDQEGCLAMARGLLGNGPDEPMSRADMIDAVSEVVNMLAGSVKARVARYATHAALGLPTFIQGSVEAASGQVLESVAVVIGDHAAVVLIARVKR